MGKEPAQNPQTPNLSNPSPPDHYDWGGEPTTEWEIGPIAGDTPVEVLVPGAAVPTAGPTGVPSTHSEVPTSAS